MSKLAEFGKRAARWRGPALMVLALGVAAGAHAGATVYKWTDASGRVVYSDQPPPANVKSATLEAPPPPANPNAAKEFAQKNAELRQRQAQREQSDQKAEQARGDAELRRTQCTHVRGQITQLAATQEVLYRVNEKGERIVLDEAARRAERERLEAWARDNCAE